MNKRFIACLLAVGVLATALMPITSAAPKVILYNIGMSAEPAIAGKNMPVTVTASVEFGGACCYTVYAHDVTADLNISADLKKTSGLEHQPITSSGETTPGRVAAMPGGGLTKVRLQWIVVSDMYGDYNLSLRVRGYSIRSPDPDEIFDQTETITISVVAGASISRPVYTHPPSVGRDTLVLVNVTSVAGGIKTVLLNYSFDNKAWTSVPMVKTTIENDNWVATIPAQQQERTLYFYMFSINSLNQTFTTPQYRETIRDYSLINTVRLSGNAIVIIGAIAGSLLIGYFYGYSRNLARKRREKGMLCIGENEFVAIEDATPEITRKQALLADRRKLVIVIMLVLTILLLAIAVATGQFTTIVSRTTNPLGS